MSVSSGTNLYAVATYNQVVVLDAIRRAPQGISRVEIAERTGLSSMTASNICRRLLAEGLIHEVGTHVSGMGKPRRILKLRPNVRFAVGIHLDPSVITVILLDLAGSVVARRSLPTPARAEHAIDRMVVAVEDLMREAGVTAHQVMGAAIAAPGPIDASSGALLNPPLLAGWDRIPLRDVLAGRLGLPVLLEKDVAAAAVAESWTGTDEGSFVFLYCGTGVGVGFALANDVVRGSSGNAGVVGKLALRNDASPMSGGRRRLGEAIQPRGVVRRAIERGALDDAPEPLDTEAVQVAFTVLAERAGAGDRAALEIVDEIAADIADGLVTVLDLLDVDRVVFGGPFWSPMAALLLPQIPALVSGSRYLALPHDIAFVEATVGEDVAAMGAACLVLDLAFSPRSSTLLLSNDPSNASSAASGD